MPQQKEHNPQSQQIFQQQQQTPQQQPFPFSNFQQIAQTQVFDDFQQMKPLNYGNYKQQQPSPQQHAQINPQFGHYQQLQPRQQSYDNYNQNSQLIAGNVLQQTKQQTLQFSPQQFLQSEQQQTAQPQFALQQVSQFPFCNLQQSQQNSPKYVAGDNVQQQQTPQNQQFPFRTFHQFQKPDSYDNSQQFVSENVQQQKNVLPQKQHNAQLQQSQHHQFSDFQQQKQQFPIGDFQQQTSQQEQPYNNYKQNSSQIHPENVQNLQQSPKPQQNLQRILGDFYQPHQKPQQHGSFGDFQQQSYGNDETDWRKNSPWHKIATPLNK